MSKYPRTEEGFARAHKTTEWMAETHKRPYALIVTKEDPRSYCVSLPSLVRPSIVEDGTAVMICYPDGKWKPLVLTPHAFTGGEDE